MEPSLKAPAPDESRGRHAESVPSWVTRHPVVPRHVESLGRRRRAISVEKSWDWPPSMDAVVAAPESHRVLFENDDVRVLEVTIAAGHREPEHTHRDPSVMIVDGPARINYYQGDTLVFSSSPDDPASGMRASWLDPEGPHSVENVDNRPYHALRVELKAH